MDATAISLAARALRTRLASSLLLLEGNIFIGHPSVAAKGAEGHTGKQFLNIFFFRIEHGGYPTDATDSDPIYVRLHCLITALGNDEHNGNNSISAGENDLRLIGGVMAALHQQPTLTIDNLTGDTSATLQAVPMPFTPENINNIWSTQQEASYRPSVAYELALAPVPFTARVDRSPRVAGTGVEVEPITDQRNDWRPEIRFIDSDGLKTALVFPIASAPGTLEIAAAGEIGDTIALRWETWNPTDGWRVADPADDTSIVIDSETLGGSSAHEVDLPRPVALATKGQSMLTALRTWEKAPGDSVILRSDPLLVSFVEDET